MNDSTDDRTVPSDSTDDHHLDGALDLAAAESFHASLQRDLMARAKDGIRALFELVGEVPWRDGLEETPERFIRAFGEMCSGYAEDPGRHLMKQFKLNDWEEGEGSSMYDQIILSGGLPFTSLCEHHLLPFSGVAHIAYLPSGTKDSVAGLSKLARVLDTYARRLQVQERLTRQVGDLIDSTLQPKACAVIIRASHSCQCMRGVKKDGFMVTSALYGLFMNNAQARSELMSLIALGDRA